jgi:hypothetical protein
MEEQLDFIHYKMGNVKFSDLPVSGLLSASSEDERNGVPSEYIVGKK